MKRLFAIGVATLVCAAPAWSDGVYNPSGSTSASIPNYTPNAGLPHWKTARAKVTGNTGNATVLVMGESTPRGWGAMFSGTSFDAASGAWPAQVAVQLRQIWGINAQANSIMGSGNVGNMTSFAAYDTRVAAANSWAIDSVGSCNSSHLVMGGCQFTNTTDTTKLQISIKNATTYPSAPNVLTDTVDLYSFNTNGGIGVGTITVDVDGGATLGSINQGQAGPSTFTKTTISTGAGAANHTWEIACNPLGFGCLATGFVFRNSAVSEASFINAGIGGATTVLWNTNTGVASPINSISAVFKPDLCLIQDQGNDQDAGTPIATYKTDLGAIITACQGSGDAMVVTSQQGQPLANLGSPTANSTLTCTSNTVTVTTSAAHGLTVGNTPWVTIAGVTPSGYNGSYQATVTGTTTFTYAVASCPGTETVPGTWVSVVPPYDVQASYAAASVAQAATNGVPVLDWFTTMCGTISGSGTSSTCSRGGWQAGIANGWNGSFNQETQDIVHQGPYAYGVLAAQVAQILAN